MHRLTTPNGTTVSYKKHGSGPALVLVHGAFSDHDSNWELVMPFFEKQFTVDAIARRGRGETDATEGHSLEDESSDAVAVILATGEPVFLVGHSYGAHVALAAATTIPGKVRKLVLYEAAWPHIIDRNALAFLENLAQAGDWNGFSTSFFNGVLSVPMEELDRLRETEFWPPILADAKASLGDLRALSRYHFNPERFRELQPPTLLQVGTESPPDLYVTTALSAVLPDVRIGKLEGQAHEGMTTAPALYADAVIEFLRD